jgi:hypothetical protein
MKSNRTHDEPQDGKPRRELIAAFDRAKRQGRYRPRREPVLIGEVIDEAILRILGNTVTHHFFPGRGWIRQSLLQCPIEGSRQGCTFEGLPTGELRLLADDPRLDDLRRAYVRDILRKRDREEAA